MKPGSEEWFRAESIQTMNAVYTAGDEEMITHNQVIESALRRVFHDGAAQAEAARVTNENIARMHAHSLEKADAKLSKQAAEILALRQALDILILRCNYIVNDYSDAKLEAAEMKRIIEAALKPTDERGK